MRKARYLLPVFLCSMVSAICTAQSKNPSGPWRFQSIFNVGVLDGQTGTALQLETINGAQYKSWFAGIGLGMDYYRFRTVPLFLDIRKEFGRNASRVFIYADGGVSFSWVTDQQKPGYADEHFSNGFYSDLGLGYKAMIGKKNALQISLGYSYKNLTESYSSYDYGYGYVPGPPRPAPKDEVKYKMNRLSIKMGWMF
jgi:hypothetical protein